jgi:hypothetical protein
MLASEAPKQETPAPKAESSAPKQETTPAESTPNSLIKKPNVDCSAMNKEKANVCPRYIPAPKLAFTAVPPMQENTWNYTDFRYSLVFIFSSWNKRSEEIATFIRPHMPEFKRRKVGVFGLASHDTALELQKWQDALRPNFPVGIASVDFIVQEKNPKLPTLWLVSSAGQLVTRQILPEDDEVQALLQKLLLWTDF